MSLSNTHRSMKHTSLTIAALTPGGTRTISYLKAGGLYGESKAIVRRKANELTGKHGTIPIINLMREGSFKREKRFPTKNRSTKACRVIVLSPLRVEKSRKP